MNDRRAAKDPLHEASARVVALVMDRLGCRNEDDLARELELPYKQSSFRTARRWWTGENAPGFDALMLMLSKAGLLDQAADEAWKGPSNPRPPLNPEDVVSESARRRRVA